MKKLMILLLAAGLSTGAMAIDTNTHGKEKCKKECCANKKKGSCDKKADAKKACCKKSGKSCDKKAEDK